MEMFCDRAVLKEELAPNEEWSLKIYGPVAVEDPRRGPEPHFYASFHLMRKDKFIAVPFGCPADMDRITIKWGLGDRDVCHIYIDDDCYVLFNYGTYRFRTRELFRLHPDPPFSAEELAALEKDNTWPD